MKRRSFCLKLLPLLMACAMFFSSCLVSTENIISQEISGDYFTPSQDKQESESATAPKISSTEPASDKEPESTPEPDPKPDPDPKPEPDPNPTPNPDPNPDSDDPAIEICDHLFGDWSEKVAPKCLGVAGLRERKCSKCGDTEQEEIYVEGHINIVDDAAKAATCVEKGLTAGSHCDACGTVIVAQIEIPLQKHTYDNDDDETCNVCPYKRVVACRHLSTQTIPGKAATCTVSGLTYGSKCAKCGEILVSQTSIDPLGHLPQTISGKPATDSEWGLTDGSKCQRCNTVLTEQKVILPTGYGNPDRYDSDYAYKALADFTNGAKMQTFYNAIATAAKNFHTDASLNAKKTSTGSSYVYVVESFTISRYGLTADEAALVWSFFRHDHPLYYWYASNYAYDNTKIYLLSSEDYAKGSVRAEYNKLIVDEVKKVLLQVQGESSPYRISLAFHDAIITEINYAYKSDGRTPEDAAWAHNILGVFEKKSGVCESYAKTFQLLLNYCEVENIYVTGRSNGENHAWNMAKMDDGKWYWFDLTWDDKPDWMLGIVYNYFCVNDTQSVSWTDGPWIYDATNSFSTTHTVFTPSSEGLYKQYSLPSRSTDMADLDLTMLRDTFVVNGFRFIVIGYNSVQLVGIHNRANAEIPANVIYDGVTYEVVAIGAISGTLLQTGMIAISGTALKTVKIPESVVFIWDNALMISTLTSITVDDGNGVYESLNGVLFTESLYTLIQYPLANTVTSYTIPDATVELANLSFGDGKYYGKLRTLKFGRSLATVGTMNAGYGYRDNANDGKLYLGNGDFLYINEYMNFQGTITLDENNVEFVIEDGALYNKDKTVLYMLLDRALTSFTCASTVQIIDAGAFYSCTRLKTLVLPAALTEIREYALAYCSFNSFIFNGSSYQWSTVKKASTWAGAGILTPSFAN